MGQHCFHEQWQPTIWIPTRMDQESKMRHIGDLVKDPSGHHKGVGIVISITRDKHEHSQDTLCIYWSHGDYNTGCRSLHVESVNEDR